MQKIKVNLPVQRSYSNIVGFQVKGVPYSNQQWIRLESDNPEGLIPEMNVSLNVGPGMSLYIGRNDQNVYRFGLWYEDETLRPGHGGFWSSNCEFVREQTGIDLVPISIAKPGDTGIAAYMRADILALISIKFGYRLVWGRFYYDDPHWHAVPIGQPNPEELPPQEKWWKD